VPSILLAKQRWMQDPRVQFNFPSPQGVAMAVHPGPEKRRVPAARLAELEPIQQALEDNQDWYEDLVEHSHDLLCVHDLAGRLLAINPAPARLLGYSVEEILRIPMRELIAPEFRDQLDSYLDEIERAGEARGFLTVMTRSGERRISKFHNTLRTEGVESPVVRGMAHDVTEQKRAEKLLLEASELNRQIVASASEGVVVYDRDLRCLAWNPSIERLTGIPASAALGKPYHELVPPDIKKHVPGTELKRALQGETILVPDEEMSTPGGPLRWIATRKCPLRNPEGEITGVIVTLRDVTERKLAEARLREYERVVEGSKEVIAVLNRDYRYVIANRALLNYRGMEKEQIIGRSIAEVIGKEAFETVFKPKLDEAFRGRSVQFEVKHNYPNAGERDVLISYFPIEGPAGIDRIAAVVQDITERKQAEEALRNSERRQHKIAEQWEAERARLIEAQAVAKVGSWEAELPSLEITWSEQTHRIFETDPSNFHPRRPDFMKFIHPEDRAKVDASFQGSLDKGAPCNVEYRIVMVDGRVKVLEEQWRIFHDEQGRPIRLMGTCRDITERKQAELALRRSEESYRMFVSESSEGIYREEMDAPVSVDLPEDELVHHILYDGHIVECNDALAAMYGLTSAKDMWGKHWAEMMAPDDPQNVELTRQFVRGRFRVLERESHEVDIHRNPKIFLNSLIGTVENGMLVRIWGIQRDITEKVKLEEGRRKAEEALRENVAQLQEVTEELWLAQEKLSEEKLYLEEAIDTELGFGEIIGNSSALKDVMAKVTKVAPSDATVLLLGETGTGKELVARALHRMSQREGKSFIKLNCAAIPSGLLESELFGHEKGAFTGAVARKLGRLELADRGTLFLDEIGEIPLSLQPKLLRVLQDLEFERLGGTQTLKVNFRLLAATNRDLLQSVKAHEFRSDLYYRLNVFPIYIPPLRQRRDDIRALVRHFVRKFAGQMRKSITSIPSRTMETLVRWEWPGNIRELENFMERSVILTPGSVLQAPLSELEAAAHPDNRESKDKVRDKEQDRILRVLRDCHGRLGGPDGAAARLGLKRTTLQSKLDHLGIKPATFRA
jgi:PAS domain S-box-containing protein